VTARQTDQFAPRRTHRHPLTTWLYWFAFLLIFVDAARHVRRIHAELARR
jgi:hypothetical protein